MIRLISDITIAGTRWGVEQLLSARGLSEINDRLKITEDLYVYGCGPFVPGRDYDELVAHSQAGDLLGIIALWFTEASVASLPAELRAHLGAVLQLAPSIYVPDKLGAHGEGNGGWCLHYGVVAKLGGHPAWCASLSPSVPSILSVTDTKDPAPATVATVGEIIEFALASQPFAIRSPAHSWGSFFNASYSEVHRFVEQIGLTDHTQHPVAVDPGILVRERRRATETVKAMYETWRNRHHPASGCHCGSSTAGAVWSRVAGACALSADPADVRDTTVSPAGDPAILDQVVEILRRDPIVGRGAPRTFAQFADETDRVLIEEAKSARELLVAKRGAPRELVLGTPFDPKTHYTDEYFGEGAGLLYTRPDGTRDIYHGPACEWDGMRAAADFLWRVYPRSESTVAHPRLIDLGCGGGCFIGHAARVGFAAHGYDISEAAIARARAAGRGHLVSLRDIVKDPPAEKVDIVTALDFWEHVFVDDIDALIEAVKGCLVDGGLGFFIICTRTAAEQDWTIPKGYVWDRTASWLVASGHVTIRLWGWWMRKFQQHGFEPEANIAYHFQVLRDQETGLTMAESWRPKNLVVAVRR